MSRIYDFAWKATKVGNETMSGKKKSPSGSDVIAPYVTTASLSAAGARGITITLYKGSRNIYNLV